MSRDVSTCAVRARMNDRDKIDRELTARLAPHGFVRRANRPHSTDVLFIQEDTQTTVSIDFEVYLSFSAPGDECDVMQTLYLGYIEEQNAKILASLATTFHEAAQLRQNNQEPHPDGEDPGAGHVCSGS
jgi:hypothetical protein